jgi:hypothetical protein
VRQLADAVNERGLYRKRDGSPVEVNQVHARTSNCEALLEKNGPMIRLREESLMISTRLIDVENLADTIVPDPAQTRHLQTRYPQVLTVAAGRSRPSRVRQSRIRARGRPGTGQ